MIKKFTLLFLSIITCSLIFAQINYGAKAGLSESFLHDSHSGNYDFRSGFQAGVFAEVPIAENLNIRPSLQFTQKGFKKVEGNPDGAFYLNRNFSFNYLELPVDLVYYFNLNQNSKILVGAGPVAGLAVSGRAKTIIKTTDQSQQIKTEYWNNRNLPDKKMDLGCDFLIGFKYNRAMISANYNHGMLNIGGDKNFKVNNRSFAFTLGYFLKK